MHDTDFQAGCYGGSSEYYGLFLFVIHLYIEKRKKNTNKVMDIIVELLALLRQVSGSSRAVS